jgi:uncharacterized protein
VPVYETSTTSPAVCVYYAGGKLLRNSLLTLMTCAMAVGAQETQPLQRFSPPYVRGTGESVIDTKPDRATIHIGVVTQAATADATASQNAKQTTAVLERIKKEIGGKGELRTTGYSVHPNYSYPNPPNNTPPRIVGYNASNTVQVKLDDIALVGRVIDAATSAGANNINGINFEVKDEQAVRRQALGQAARNARASAEALASALGLKVVRVLSADTGEPVMVQPMHRMAMARMAEARAPTPVEPGSIQVRATVVVTLEVAP